MRERGKRGREARKVRIGVKKEKKKWVELRRRWSQGGVERAGLRGSEISFVIFLATFLT